MLPAWDLPEAGGVVEMVMAGDQMCHRLAGRQCAGVRDYRRRRRDVHTQLVQHDVIPELDDGSAPLVDAPDPLADTL